MRWRQAGAGARPSPPPLVGGARTRRSVRRAAAATALSACYFTARDEHGRAPRRLRATSTWRPRRRRVGSTPSRCSARAARRLRRQRRDAVVPGRSDGDGCYLYYTGWSLGVTVPFYLAIGLAVSSDGGETFERVSARRRSLGRATADPFLHDLAVRPRRGRRAGACGTCRAPAGAGAAAGPKHSLPHQVRRVATTGSAGRRTGESASTSPTTSEYAFARPCVLRDGDRYRMWFSSAATRYRIGYAESDDGLRWDATTRRRASTPATGWDSRDGRVPVRVRPRRATAHALQRQRLRRDGHRAGDVGSKHEHAAVYVAANGRAHRLRAARSSSGRSASGRLPGRGSASAWTTSCASLEPVGHQRVLAAAVAPAHVGRRVEPSSYLSCAYPFDEPALFHRGSRC